MAIVNVRPKRGSGDFGSEQKMQGSPHSLFLSVERTRDDREGMHTIRYFIAHEFGFADADASNIVTFPPLPANARVLGAYLEVLSAFDAASAVVVLGTDVIGDEVAVTPGFLACVTGLPKKYATPTTPIVAFADAVTEGSGILWVEVISYMDK
jgi:hypothetical protein